MNSIHNIGSHRIEAYTKALQPARVREAAPKEEQQDSFVRSTGPSSFTAALEAVQNAAKREEYRPERVSAVRQLIQEDAYVVEISSLMRRMCE